MNKILANIKYPMVRKSNLPVSLRTHKDEAGYLRAKQKGISSKPLNKEEPIQEWKGWILIINEFPYSAAFDTHHMLVPKREVTKDELNKSEREELNNIIDELNDKYDCLLLNFNRKQSIKKHFHIHLLTYKNNRKDIKL
ncbi:hypothetical protein KC950_02745 [Candidatus Saccharibacteria bacterium]|nr:hypothetical protein [Candidatus Saccharibacteria bacterium]